MVRIIEPYPGILKIGLGISIRKGGASDSKMLRAKITEVSISAYPSVPDLWLPRSTCTETGRFEMNTQQIQPEVVFASERSERAKLQAASRKLQASLE